jgi:3'-phosphoadenosine 5'-phosphosulfate sulfotransferase (PAPS reductase)/FAD synthetase
MGLQQNRRAKSANEMMRTIPYDVLKRAVDEGGHGVYKIRELLGLNKQKNGEKSMFDYSRYLWAVKCPYKISNMCCSVMKKSPAHSYSTKTGRLPMLATMASESRLRTTDWLRNGCNGFNMKRPRSTPISFWTEQDVLLYIYQNKIPIASVYGEVIKENEVEGQLDFEDLGIFDLGIPTLKTTGRKRTGCMFCGFGCHLEKPGEGRFEQMKQTHPKQYEWIMKPWEDGGLGYKDVIDWLNENGDLHIRY